MKKFNRTIAALAVAVPLGMFAVSAAEAGSYRGGHSVPSYSQSYGQGFYGKKHGGYKERRVLRRHAANPWKFGIPRRTYHRDRRW